MFLQFLVENYRSFQGETLLNLVPAKSRIHRDHEIEDAETGRKVKALPLALFYGANASGKSNLIKAIAFARRLIVTGTRPNQVIGVVPFLLDKKSALSPSKFEFVLKYKGVLYTYGFAVTKQCVVEEWLMAVLNRKEVVMFERNTQADRVTVEFGEQMAVSSEVAQRLKFLAEGTRPNQLFLTEAFSRNESSVKDLVDWFTNVLNIVYPNTIYEPLVLRAHGDKTFAKNVGKILKLADTGIDSLVLHKERFDANQHFRSMPDEFRKQMLNDLSLTPGHAVLIEDAGQLYALSLDEEHNPTVLSLTTSHLATDGSQVEFSTKDESDGSRRLMHLAPVLLNLQNSERVYVIDELDRSLHPHISRMFIENFLSGIVSGENKGQLLVSTHDTCLMDFDILRRDEVWFVEKDKTGASHISSLIEYDVRSDLRVDKGYLNGRFGAIPMIGCSKRLTGGCKNEPVVP